MQPSESEVVVLGELEKRDFYGYTVYSNGDILGKTGVVLSQRSRNGRKDVALTINGKRRPFTVARLVYCVFNDIDIFTFDKNQCVTSIDGNNLNTSLDNLQCVFRGDLIQGDGHTSINKLTDAQVEQIKYDYQRTIGNRPVNQHDKKGEYNSYRSLAKDYGVTYTLIKQVIEGDTRNSDKYILKK